MHNPQAPAPPSDIEQGKKKDPDHKSDVYGVGQTIALPLASSPNMNNAFTNQTFCCCNSVRTVSIFWFSISLILELVSLISSCLQEDALRAAGIIVSVLFMILSIQGLIGCILFKSTQIMFALIGVIIKALLNLLGFIVLLASSGGLMEIDFEESEHVDFIMVALVILLFYGFGVVVMWRLIKERNASVED
ncbi:predicted protein [Chaetoceros tenuissimus]|uniref:Uncharacterized protein n=1 Tax=Chaetoceros tenuissimus TaxID=426638 RepID=A0AAD3GZA0_9STRA|nr:predicted protein [Chaetoceros tenuissimus]